MSISELPRTAAYSTAAYQLRLHGGTEDERLINVPPGKHSVGSGPRCQIRLTAPGVGAMECLIVCDRSGLRVRRWSDKTLLNGEAFEEAGLAAGDVLAVGPAELVVVAREENTDGATADSWTENNIQAACDAIDDIFLNEEGAVSNAGDWHDDRPSRPTQRIVRTPPGTPPSPPAPATSADSLTKSAVRRRSRRALAVIRRQRRDHDELLARVSELELMLAQSLAEPAAPQPASTEPLQHELAEAQARLGALNEQLVATQDQLAVRDSELKQARYSIDALERQLIDSQHTMNAFADERGLWDEQFSEIESRLARYVNRIQELEQQLAEGQSTAENTSNADNPEISEEKHPAAEAAESGIDWAADLAPSADPSAAEVELPQETNLQADPAWEPAAATATAVEEPPQESAESEYDWREIVDEPATETSEAEVETAVAPEWKSATESLDATEDLSEQLRDEDAPIEDQPEAPSNTETNDVEEALEHLRGVSIWREEPTQSEADGPETGAESPAPANETAPVSFLDRYAHMFSDDETAPPPSIPHEDTTVPLREAAPPPAAHTDEESVEQYMAKLLERMRGGPAGGPGASSQATNNEEIATQPPAAVVERQPEPVDQPMFTHLEEMRTKAPAPEQPSDMAAMRALANQSARHALSLHAARKLRRTAITRVIVTALAASVSVYLLLNSATWKSLAFAAGCAAGFAAIYWGMLTMGTLLKGFQLGAFDDYEEELTPEQSLNPPLPIDVDGAASDKDSPVAAE